jgi:two-component system, cell cycle sensor histidine kinase and response regulator CckA
LTFPTLDRHLEIASLSGEVRAVMAGIVDGLMEFEGVDGASLSTVDGDLAHFMVCAGADLPLEGQTMPLDETLGIECVHRSEVTVLRTTTGPEVSRCLTPGAGSIVLAPIEYDGAIRGILGVRSADTDAFDSHEVELIAQLSRGAAIALRNAELVERLAGSERQYRELHAQAADATLVGSIDGDLTDANDAASALLWYSTGELTGINVRSLLAEERTDISSERRDLVEQRETRGERAFRRKDGAILTLEYSSRLLDDGRVHTSLRDVSQRKRNEERLRSSLGQLHAIVQTQQEISELELDPDAVTATIVERTRRLAGADGVAVQWFDGNDSVFHHASGSAAAHVGLRLDRGSSLAGLAALTGETLHAPDTENDTRVDLASCRRVRARSLICTPLYRDREIAGVLSVIGATPHCFDELAVETSRLMAEFVSAVIRNANELEDRRRFAEELRMKSEVVKHMQSALWVWAAEPDGSFSLEYANDASEAAIGLDTESIIGRRLEEVLPSDAGFVLTILRRVVETGESVDAGEVEYADERVAPSVFTMKAFPLPGARVAVTFDNVTEAVRSRRALQESEARFRGAFHASSLGMALTGLDGRFVQVNDRLAEMLGYSVDELMQLGVRGITHPEDLATDLEYGEKLRGREIDSYRREKRYLRRDGSILWAELTVSLVAGYDDAPTHVVSHVQDITAQKEASLLFEATFERSVVAKLICDDARRLIDLNDAASELLGIGHDDMGGVTLDELLADEPVTRLWPMFLASGTMEAEATLHRPDGGKRRVEFVATANVRPGRHIAVVRDLTRQKELEAQLRQAQKMEAVGRLAGGVAHDFNNLLTAISGYSEFLIAGLTDERLSRHADEIRKAAARAAALTGQLLAFSRRQVLQPRVLDLNAVVSDMDMMLRRLIGEDVQLMTLLDPELAAVRADPTQLEQVIVNLAVNARDAMPGGGSVTIVTSNVVLEDGSFVELRLTDTGIGMNDAERAQLFDPFFTTKAGGTGLGLATVYGIVEQSGGTIEVESAPGMGSSFRILFPSVTTPAEDLADATPGAAPRAGDETVLLVEDETVVRQLVAEILEMNGYTVLQAGDGPSALELVRRHGGTIELLITDVVMPGMSGPEVAQAVTSMRGGTEVLYMSGYTDSAIGHHGVLEPDVAFLQKPFSADDLTRKVRSLLDEHSAVTVE